MKYILFVCTHNAGRSQMAQAFWKKYAPADVRAESAGQEPAKAPWPEVVEVMREVGIDISQWRPKKLDADAILAGYDDVPVQSMVQTIAYREARECLREDRCAAMTVE